MIKSFKRNVPPPLVSPAKKRARASRWRGSRQSRGYDRDWEKLRAEYAEDVDHLCEECDRRGYVAPLDVVDHMIPVTDAPERRLDKANLDGLCNIHHNGLKRKVENYARKMGQLELLPVWMKNPDTRPAQFQIIRYGPLGKPDERGERGEF